MIMNPSGEILLEEDDILIALGNNSQIGKLKEIAGRRKLIDIT